MFSNLNFHLPNKFYYIIYLLFSIPYLSSHPTWHWIIYRVIKVFLFFSFYCNIKGIRIPIATIHNIKITIPTQQIFLFVSFIIFKLVFV